MDYKKNFNKCYDTCKLFIMKFFDEGIMKDAANLTFISIVAIVPMLSFALLIIPNILDVDKSVYLAKILDNFIPETAEKVKDIIEITLNKKVSLNIYSFIFVGVGSFSMFNILNKTFDRILGIHLTHKIDFLTKVSRFVASILFGFVIMILIFTLVSASVIQDIPIISTFARIVSYLIPIILQFTLLIILYLFMPSIKIRRYDVFKGTIITTIAWYIAKFGFDIYVLNSSRFDSEYGLLATIPITVLWLYINWLLILSGILIISLFRKNSFGEPIDTNSNRRFHKLQLDVRIILDSKEYSNLKTNLKNKDMNNILGILQDSIKNENNNGDTDEKKSTD